MKLMKPSVQLIDEPDLFKRIEKAGRTCYKSEQKISESSAYPFFQSICKRGHESVLEHSNIIVRTHTPYMYVAMIDLLTEYTECTGLPHYIRYTQYDKFEWQDYSEPELYGRVFAEEYIFSGNVRAWRSIVRRFRNEDIVLSLFREHPAFFDLFDEECKLWDYSTLSKDKIEIVDNVDGSDFKDRHTIKTLRIVANRGVIDEFARHRAFAHSVESTRYCVAGDTLLKTSNESTKLTVKDLYNNICNSKNGSWKRVNVKQYNEDTGNFIYSKVKGVFFMGKKECVEIKTKLGYRIKCTLDHPLLTDNGYINAGDFSVGDNVYVNGTDKLYKNKDWLYNQNITLNKTFVDISKEFGFNVSTLKAWARKHGLPKKGTGYFNVGREPWNKGVDDKRLSDALRKYHHSGLNDTRKIIKENTTKYQKHKGNKCEVCNTIESLEVHHIDKDRSNNYPNNLITLCKSCHQKLHNNNLSTAYNDTIISIERCGMLDVYDVSMDSEYHNFIANGFVAHNCNYSKSNEENEGCKYIYPSWYFEKSYEDELLPVAFYNICKDSEDAYMNIMRRTKTPQTARGALNLWTKSEQVMTGTVEQWKEFLKLRDSSKAHPDAQQLAKMIREVLDL